MGPAKTCANALLPAAIGQVTQLCASLAAGECTIRPRIGSHPSRSCGLPPSGSLTSGGAASGGRTMTRNRSPLPARLTLSLIAGAWPVSGRCPNATGTASATAKLKAANTAPTRASRNVERNRIKQLRPRTRYLNAGGGEYVPWIGRYSPPRCQTGIRRSRRLALRSKNSA